MTSFIRHYLLALQFFTRIPVTGALARWVGFSPAMLRASAGHFPGVGVLVGALVAIASAGLWALLARHNALVPLVVAVLGTVVSVLVTGGFHEDGLADLADGLGGSQTRERVLEIMKDSRVGAFGAMALVLALLSKVSLLALIGAGSAVALVLAVFAAHVVSRSWPLLHIRFMAHVGDAAGSKSKPLADQISASSLLIGLMWCFAALAPVFIALSAIESGAYSHAGGATLRALAGALLASGLGWAAMARLLWRRLQGFTGDGLGATQQVCEIAFYLGWALAA